MLSKKTGPKTFGLKQEKRVWADDPFLLEKWQTDNREQKLHLQAAKWCSGEVGDGLSFAQSA
jgi:hypothetical protein